MEENLNRLEVDSGFKFTVTRDPAAAMGPAGAWPAAAGEDPATEDNDGRKW